MSPSLSITNILSIFSLRRTTDTNLNTNAIEEPHQNQAITSHNASTSRLYQLPTELILIIDTFLPGPSALYPHVAKMAFRASCRRFRAILPGPPDEKPSWPHRDRKMYTQMLKLCRFRTLCSNERTSLLPTDQLVCCICRSTHESKCFTEAEKRKQPEHRRCIGTSGVLELCPHFRITYMGLRLTPVNIVCNRKHYDIVTGGSGSMHVRQIGEEEGEVVAEVELRLLEIKSGDEREGGEGVHGNTLTKEKVLDAVRNAGWRLCPHMHSRSVSSWLPPSLFDYPSGHDSRFSKAKCHVCSVRCGFGRWCTHGEQGEIWPVHTCKAPDCDTRFTLLRDMRRDCREEKDDKAKESEFLILRVERFLGKMESADDRRWMGQLVEASKLDEDQFLGESTA